MSYDLVVVGGGPGGSTTAALAARDGLRVLLLEADRHPRVHVGESLLPGIIPILDAMGALDDVTRAGFTRKTGSTHWDWGRTPQWDLWFTDSEAYDHAWLVDRARFDEILFRAAARAGADAREGAHVTTVHWDGERARGVTWRDAANGALHSVDVPTVVDATGQAALIARRLALQAPIPGLRNHASWAHFEDARHLPPPREGQAFFVATATNWAWAFPLSDHLTSLGIVRLEDDPARRGGRLSVRFEESLRANTRLMGVLGDGLRRVTPVHHVRDWSYRMARVAGPGWFLVGDASGFIDPCLSTGVLLAMHSGFLVARGVAQVARGAKDEATARAEYEAAHRGLFEDLLRIVRFFYQQQLHREDYFWESKRMLVEQAPDIKPQKAFVVLTSGLVRNLAYDETHGAAATRRRGITGTAGDGANGIEAHDPDRLGFVCAHLRHAAPGDAAPASLYVLVEPVDRVAPALFRTLNWDVNCLAPRYANDPIGVPALAPHLRAFADRIGALDHVPGEALAAFWRRCRGEIVAHLRALPPAFELVRVFGE